MTHVRKQIRDLAVTAVTGLAVTGSRVYSDRAYSISEDNLPALRVFFSGETGEMVRGAMGANPTMHRRAILNVAGFADGAGLDDTLDQIALEVEISIDGAGNFGGRTVGGAVYVGTDFVIDEGDSRIGRIVMRWEIQYRTAWSDPGTAV